MAPPPPFVASTAGVPPELQQPEAPERRGRLRRRRLVFIVLVVLVAVGLALGGVKLYRSSHATPANEKFLAMVGEIAKVNRNSPSVAGQQKALLNERKHACRTNSRATVAALARRAYVLEHSTNANRRALGAGYLAAVTVSCPAKKQSFDAALAVVTARK
jgi:asparagine N-glycosylation enzyme membrane subunit Stt3